MKKVISRSQTGFLLDVDVKEKLIELSSLLGKSMTKIISDLVCIEHLKQKYTPLFPKKIRGNRVFEITVNDQDYEVISSFIGLAYGIEFPCESDVRKHIQDSIEHNAMWAAKELVEMRELDRAMKKKEKIPS